jgi:hypothetical protein
MTRPRPRESSFARRDPTGRAGRGNPGIRGILVHAISEDAKRFYGLQGFTASPVNPMTLVITVAEALKAL